MSIWTEAENRIEEILVRYVDMDEVTFPFEIYCKMCKELREEIERLRVKMDIWDEISERAQEIVISNYKKQINLPRILRKELVDEIQRFKKEVEDEDS